MVDAYVNHFKTKLRHRKQSVFSNLNLNVFYRSLQGSNPQAGDITAQLNNTLPQLMKAIQDAVVRQLAEDFIDVTKPLLPLTRAALEPPGN